MTTCDICGKEYSNMSSLTNHIKKLHTKISPKDYYIKYVSTKENEHICRKPLMGSQ